MVLTHDVEGPFGLSHLLDVLALERARGFRSSISFVGDTYEVPDSLLREVREAGFEVALHGWRHDGRLFESRARFDRRLPGMNARLRQWGAVGFRSPMTHRVPSWMQGLEVEWDSSFFDTDPFEPMPGGVMTIWPYVMGRFVELPYTLPQDHTLIETLGETSPRIWLEKLDFLAGHGGMALVNTHPDYLCRGRLALYEEFLDELGRRPGRGTPCRETSPPGRGPGGTGMRTGSETGSGAESRRAALRPPSGRTPRRAPGRPRPASGG